MYMYMYIYIYIIHIHIHYTYTYTYPLYVHLYWLADQKHLAAILQVESLAEILSTWCSRSRNRPREGFLAEVMNVSFVILDTWCLEGCGQIKLQGMVTSRYPGGTVSCSASRADPAEQPRAYSDWKTTLQRSIEIKFNCCWVPTYISQNQSSVPTHCSIRLATATHLSQALCQHAEVLHGMAAWQIGGVFCLQHQEHLFQWIQGGAQGSMGRNPTACPCPVQRKLIDLSSWPARQAVARCLVWMSKPVVLLSHAVCPSKGPCLLRHMPGASLSNVLASWAHTLDDLQRAEIWKGLSLGKRLRYYALNVFSKDLGMGSRASNRPAKSDFFDTKPSIWELINLKLCIA